MNTQPPEEWQSQHLSPNEDNNPAGATVYVVDDDPEHLEFNATLLRSLQYNVATFNSGQEFVESHDDQAPGCAVIDVIMPNFTGIDVQKHLVSQTYVRPHILLSGLPDVPMAVAAMARGAAGFLVKPYRVHELLKLVQGMVMQDVQERRENQEQMANAARLERLTGRERQVLELVLQGKPNKRIATIFQISQRTVELHRSHIMKKMRAHSLADLFRSALPIEARLNRQAQSSL